jgi:hypothetical protein
MLPCTAQHFHSSNPSSGLVQPDYEWTELSPIEGRGHLVAATRTIIEKSAALRVTGNRELELLEEK